MDEIKNAYRNRNLILFVGAGVPMTLGLPSWASLVGQIGNELGYDPDVFNTYGDPLALVEYYKIKKGAIGALRSWMDREWHHDGIDIKQNSLYQTIANGNFPIIYTTNFDRWLEISYEKNNVKYRKIANVTDLVSLDAKVKQIIKYHGDFDDDESLVFSETDYFERLQFEFPLDIKLRSDLLGKSVLFVGYSWSDINIRLLFYKLTKMWNRYDNLNVRPKSYLFSIRPNPVQEAVLRSRGIQMLTSEHSPKIALTKFMAELCSNS